MRQIDSFGFLTELMQCVHTVNLGRVNSMKLAAPIAQLHECLIQIRLVQHTQKKL